MANLTSIREIKTDMIMRYARAYAHTNPLPKSEMEFARVLYEFDKTVQGGLEAMLDRALELQRDIQSLSMAPILVRKDALTITEVSHGD